MAYEEYDYYNEPSTGSLKDSLYEILRGLQNPQNLRETSEGISRVRQALPGVTESVGRGAIAAVPGSIGDISDFARTYAPEIMEKKFGKERFFPTTREILDYVPRMTPTHEGATTLEDVGAAISPGVGGVTRDIAIPAAKAYGRYVGPTAYKHLEDYLIKTGGIQQMMAGEKSKTFNPELKKAALNLEKENATPEQIWEATGMVRGLDQQWRSEISDKFAKMKEGENFKDIHRRGGLNGVWSKDKVTVNDVLDHPEFFEAYPTLGNIKVVTHKADNPVKGSFHQNKGEISIREDLNPEEAKSTILHELTHGVQAKEQWNRGANAGQLIRHYAKEKEGIMSQIEDLNRQGSEAYKADDMDKYRQLMAQRDILSKKYINFDPEEIGYDMYKHHGGEAEARLVQRRANLSNEQLKQSFPYQFTGKTGYGLDINPDEAIITTKHPGIINQPSQEFDYRGVHTAPYRTEDGLTAPAYELNRTYPDDVYGPMSYRYYGHGGDATKMDKETVAILQAAKGNPNHPMTIYRAVPKELAGEDIYTGDWVTPNINYAKEHGRRFDDGYHIIEKTVPAKHIWTNADSIHEFGYDPTE